MKARVVWGAIGAIVIGHNVTVADGGTLSECVDDWIAKRPWATRAVIVALALHLSNAISERHDPVHALFIGARWLYPLRRQMADAIAPPETP